jgi:hypothetical protein
MQATALMSEGAKEPTNIPNDPPVWTGQIAHKKIGTLTVVGTGMWAPATYR